MARWTFAMLAALLCVSFTLPALGQWKWRDKNGQTQYSDLPPPPTVREQDILSRPSATKQRSVATGAPSATAATGAATAASGSLAAASAVLAPKTVDPELEAKRKKAEAEQAAKTKAEEAKVAAARTENCTRAKAQLRTLDSGVRIAHTNEKGEREILDDKQRAEDANRARDIIAADCK